MTNKTIFTKTRVKIKENKSNIYFPEFKIQNLEKKFNLKFPYLSTINSYNL